MQKDLIQKVLIVLDLLLFLPVLFLFSAGQISSNLGFAVLIVWVAVFFATVIMFTVHLSQGSDWYHYGIMLTTGMLIAIIIGMVIGFDLYGILLLVPFTVMAVMVINWMFIDTSEDEVMKDLQRLSRKIR